MKLLSSTIVQVRVRYADKVVQDSTAKSNVQADVVNNHGAKSASCLRAQRRGFTKTCLNPRGQCFPYTRAVHDSRQGSVTKRNMFKREEGNVQNLKMFVGYHVVITGFSIAVHLQ